jgi:hypothetical protein
VWERTVDGRALNFHLSGINNQNFIMRDEETGSWWQQVTGECIAGPLKGRVLNPVTHDEIAFAVWKYEQPAGKVLKPDERVASKYASADWEEKIQKAPVVTPSSADDPLAPRALVIGVEISGEAKAYPLTKLQQLAPVFDRLGGVPVVILMNDDKKSVRVFDRRLDENTLELYEKPNSSLLVDAGTGSVWDFTGKAISGQLAGRQLRKIKMFSDYWFDWKTYHPNTSIY